MDVSSLVPDESGELCEFQAVERRLFGLTVGSLSHDPPWRQMCTVRISRSHDDNRPERLVAAVCKISLAQDSTVQCVRQLIYVPIVSPLGFREI